MESIACCTPSLLRTLSAQSLVNNLLLNCKPQCHGVPFEDLDAENLLLARRTKHKKHLWDVKESLITRLKLLRWWWDGTNGLGALPSHLQTEVRFLLNQSLLHIDKLNPLLRLLLQLLYTDIAGEDIEGFTSTHFHQDEKSCHSFAKVLESLAPFRLKELNILGTVFADPQPLAVIIKNSPNIRVIKMYSLKGDHILKLIGKHCNNLEVLMAYNHKNVSKHCLFEMFFLGLDKSSVVKNLNSKNCIQLSFPQLAHIDISHLQDSTDFPFTQILMHFYPNLQSVYPWYYGHFSATLFSTSLLVPHLMQKDIFKVITRSPCNLKSILLSIYDLDTLSIDEIEKLYPEVKHLIFMDDARHVFKSSNLFVERLIALIQRLDITGLCVQFWYPYRLFQSDVYLPAFTSTGIQFKSLAFHFEDVEAGLPSKLINKCPKLESLKIVVNQSSRFQTHKPLNLESMFNLSRLSVWSEDQKCYSPNFHLLVEQLVILSPNIINLEIDVRELKFDWKTICQKNILQKLESLSVIGESNTIFPCQLRPNFRERLQDLIDLLPSLEKLILYYTSPDDVRYFRYIYRRTALNVYDGTLSIRRDKKGLIL
ncbi:unnamed protein product [Meganyctiphanes norvegica]|uniref:Uncharacterized protein n=1 Tax=Meganyctiphanes norvegica TaxID=48144 RepID=A0AAV2QZ97_MEGNR